MLSKIKLLNFNKRLRSYLFLGLNLFLVSTFSSKAIALASGIADSNIDLLSIQKEALKNSPNVYSFTCLTEDIIASLDKATCMSFKNTSFLNTKHENISILDKAIEYFNDEGVFNIDKTKLEIVEINKMTNGFQDGHEKKYYSVKIFIKND